MMVGMAAIQAAFLMKLLRDEFGVIEVIMLDMAAVRVLLC
jgi:hypothetical protein